MAISVKDPSDDSSVPFLRGILTRSLQQAGLSFEEAYSAADRIKASLHADAEITPAELAKIVTKDLRREGHAEIADRYESAKGPVDYVTIVDRGGQPQPFSKGRVAQSLEVCALDPARSFQITTRLEQAVRRRGTREMSSDELAHLTHSFLLRNESKAVARRYAIWLEFTRSTRPLIILIGGTTGSGKSTIGAEIAHRLNIIRTQSTDMLREVMRLMLPTQLVPELHESSFNAWRALPTVDMNAKRAEAQHIEQGYLIQSNQVAVAIEAVIKRAEAEQVSLILEGIHVHPGIQNQLRESADAIIVPIVLAVLKRKQLRKQLIGRSHLVTSRRAERYLDHFDQIWQLQSFLLNEADRHDIPIIPNGKQDEAMRHVMQTIIEHLSVEFSGEMEELQPIEQA